VEKDKVYKDKAFSQELRLLACSLKAINSWRMRDQDSLCREGAQLMISGVNMVFPVALSRMRKNKVPNNPMLACVKVTSCNC